MLYSGRALWLIWLMFKTKFWLNSQSMLIILIARIYITDKQADGRRVGHSYIDSEFDIDLEYIYACILLSF